MQKGRKNKGKYMNIIIESMTQSHLDKIRDNLQENFDEFWNENVLKSELENPASTYIVAIDEENDNEVVGYAGIWQPIDEAHITNIVTKKDKRKNKIATKMLERLIEISKQRKLNNITLEVNITNTPAINLYKKYNFEEVGLRKKYYNNTDDAIIMTLKLDVEFEG